MQRSTKTTDRKSALKITQAWEGVAEKRATEGQARRVISDLHEQIHGSPLASFTVDEYAQRWLATKKIECRAVTFSAYKGAVDSFLESLGDRKDLSIAYVTPTQVSGWRDSSAVRATPRTANNKLKIVRVLLQCAWRDGLLPDGNPAAKVSVLATQESARRPLTMEEVRKVLSVASDAWRGMVLAGLYTGQRLKDLAGLTWDKVDLDTEEIRLATSKTGRRQFIPLAKPLVAFLRARRSCSKESRAVFPEFYPYAVKDGGSAQLSADFREVLAKAGLVEARSSKKESKGKGRGAARQKSEISFHSLRHTATTMLKKAGVAESVTRDLIGHDTVAMSNNYTHIPDESKRAAVALLPDVTQLSPAKPA